MNLNNFKKANHTQKIVSTLIIFLLFCAILYFAVYKPTTKKIIELRNDILFQKVDMEKKLAQNSNMVKLSEKLDIIEPELDILDSVFINKNRELEFITTLEGIANKHNLIQTLSLSFEQAVNEQGYKKTPINISINGALNDAVEYLNELEKINYYINISNLNINQKDSSTTGASNPRITLSIQAVTYWQ